MERPLIFKIFNDNFKIHHLSQQELDEHLKYLYALQSNTYGEKDCEWCLSNKIHTKNNSAFLYATHVIKEHREEINKWIKYNDPNSHLLPKFRYNTAEQKKLEKYWAICSLIFFNSEKKDLVFSGFVKSLMDKLNSEVALGPVVAYVTPDDTEQGKVPTIPEDAPIELPRAITDLSDDRTGFQELTEKIRSSKELIQWKKERWSYYHGKHSGRVNCYICHEEEATQIHHSSWPFFEIVLFSMRENSTNFREVNENQEKYEQVLKTVNYYHKILRMEDSIPTCKECNMWAESKRKNLAFLIKEAKSSNSHAKKAILDKIRRQRGND